MKRTCEECGKTYDDTYHWTTCPHEYFPMHCIVSKSGKVVGVARSVEDLRRLLDEKD